MNIKTYILLVLFQFVFLASFFGQDSYFIGYLPSLNLNTKVSKSGSLNFNLQQRNSLYRSDENKFNHSYVLTDLTVVYGYKVGLFSKISLGGLVRYADNEFVTRTLQQFSSVKQLNKLKLINRLRFDQTYLPSFVEHRLRYRLGFQIPLSGAEVDTREFYIKMNNEYLNSYSENVYDLEARLISNLGFVMSNKNKLEIGLDYRLSNLVTRPLNHTFWTTISLYINLN